MELNDFWGFLIGAGSASSVIGAVILRKINKTLDNLEQIPVLIDSVADMDKDIHRVHSKVDGFSGELRALERSMYDNQTKIAQTDQKAIAAFREIDSINRKMEL